MTPIFSPEAVVSSHIFAQLPKDLSNEVFETLLHAEQLRIERIVSKGHSSPPDFWYDQAEHEWVLVLQGEAIVALEDKSITLKAGDYLNIPAHVKHRVEWTTPEQETIWLAIFY
ncbi:cupin domain-containing protein [Thiofilum flexile]|uniref:cupin domain-containing protein n=1 Tax=Thiofilum flexile TaxID=125627 RepID=UPI000367959B|nr:cupin domain-containing protein [Thiofilum flexile]